MTHLSYWEHDTYFSNIDFAIIGSGIVGLNAAINIKRKNTKAKVVVFERGLIPSGASTKNAGFACFGSVTELLADIEKNGEDACCQLVEMRWKGLHKLRNLLSDEAIGYTPDGGYEIFAEDENFTNCLEQLSYLNKLLAPIFKEDVYANATQKIPLFGLAAKAMIACKQEAQIDTGKMMASLIALAASMGIIILNGCTIQQIQDNVGSVSFSVNSQAITAGKVLICTNGFAKQFAPHLDVEPARAQVLITKPINNLLLKGSFHFDEGYYYFRNIHNRILLGGGRNLDFSTENTTEFGLTNLVQAKLEQLLKEVIAPNTTVEIEQRWSGIMGLGADKKPIVQAISNNIIYAVRMGGMGVAIGSLVGEMAAELSS